MCNRQGELKPKFAKNEGHSSQNKQPAQIPTGDYSKESVHVCAGSQYYQEILKQDYN